MSRWADAFRALQRSVDTLDTDDTQRRNVPPVHSVNTVHCVTPITKQDVQGADRFSGLALSADTLDTDDTLRSERCRDCSVSRVSTVTPIGSPGGERTNHLRGPTRSADTLDTDDTLRSERCRDCSVSRVSTVTPIGSPGGERTNHLRGPTRSADTLDTNDTLAGRNIESAQSVNIVHCVTAIGAPDPEDAIARLAVGLLSQAERNPAIRITDRAKALDYFRTRAAAGDADSKSTAKPPQPESPSATLKLPKVAEIIHTWPGARFVQFIDE
jgi:hypothetical protein